MHTVDAWPNGAKAAVSFSYDDGNENNLDQAIPDLEAADFRGTFYLTTGNVSVQTRAADWRAAHERGHEIGNHTVSHPCRGDFYLKRNGKLPPWLTNPLEAFTPQMIDDEVTTAAQWIEHHIGIDPDRTFAHPCAAVAIGEPADEASYDAAISRHHFAARVAGDCINVPDRIDLMRIHSHLFATDAGAPLVAFAEAALAVGGWAVFMFHGIGGPSHETSRAAHQAIIDHVRQGPYWAAPVKAVARYVERQR